MEQFNKQAGAHWPAGLDRMERMEDEKGNTEYGILCMTTVHDRSFIHNIMPRLGPTALKEWGTFRLLLCLAA